MQCECETLPPPPEGVQLYGTDHKGAIELLPRDDAWSESPNPTARPSTRHPRTAGRGHHAAPVSFSMTARQVAELANIHPIDVVLYDAEYRRACAAAGVQA